MVNSVHTLLETLRLNNIKALDKANGIKIHLLKFAHHLSHQSFRLSKITTVPALWGTPNTKGFCVFEKEPKALAKTKTAKQRVLFFLDCSLKATFVAFAPGFESFVLNVFSLVWLSIQSNCCFVGQLSCDLIY